MKPIEWDVKQLHISASDAFSEASAEELRALICLLETDGKAGVEAIAKTAKISKARAGSALAFWQAALEAGTQGQTVVDEFDYRLRPSVLDDMTGTETANVIRDNALSALYEECAAVLGKPVLNDTEVRDIAALYSQYALGEEFILTLLTDMAKRSRVTVRTFVNKAIDLHGKGITTIEELSDYFTDRDNQGEWERRTRKALGIFSRALTSEEKTCFRKWVELYGYNEDVLTLAYDKTVAGSGKYSLAYMDKILTDWYQNRCLTKEECEARAAASRPVPAGKKDKKEKPRYGNFDPDEAFRNALARSMGESPEKK